MSGQVAKGVGVRQTLRRIKALIQAAQGRLPFLLTLIGVPILIVLSYSFPLGQVYLVEARTLGARITVTGPDAVWKLPNATLCSDRGANKDIRLATNWTGTGCNPGLFEINDLTGTEIRMPSGVQIQLRAESDGSVLLRRLSDRSDQTKAGSSGVRLTDQHNWTPGSLLRIEPTNWQRVTLLEFAGDVEIGQETGSGANAYLIEGRYEVREHFLRQYRPWGTTSAEPTTVVTGTLYRGDRVAFHKPTKENTSALSVLATGFIAPNLDLTPGFSIVASSSLEHKQAQLRIKSFGTRETQVTPTWIDRALRDPLLLALTAILGFAVTALTLVVEIKKISFRGRGQ